MSAIKLRSIEITNFLCFSETVKFQWVDNPKDYDEPTPMKIGFCGINGTGKSTAISRALPWLMHPISNSLEAESSRGFNDPEKSMKVEIYFEWMNKIYSASRKKFADGEMETSLLMFEKDGTTTTKLGKWDLIFGDDGDSASFLPYLWENSKLQLAAASMGSEGGLHYFSSNLGTREFLNEIEYIIEELRSEKRTKDASKMTPDELEAAKKFSDDYDSALQNKKDLIEEQKQVTTILKKYEKYGDFSAYSTNFTALEEAERKTKQKRNALDLKIGTNAANKIYHKAAISSIADHLESVYGLPRSKYPIQSSPTTEITAAKGFIEDLEWAYNAIKGANNKEINKILEKIEQIADNELFFEIGMLISSDSEVPKNQIDETIVVIQELNEAIVDEKMADSNVKSSGKITDTEFTEWKSNYDREKKIVTELKDLKRRIAALKSFNDEVTGNETVDEEVKTLAKKIRSAKLIQSAVEELKQVFEVQQRQKMLDTATQYLKSIPTTAKFRLELVNDMVVPKKTDDGKEYPLHKTDKPDGPSAGQGRLIANSVMLARYVLTECNVPLILDDAFEKIDAIFLQQFFDLVLDMVHESDRQLIWVQHNRPENRHSEFKIVYGYPIEAINEYLKIDVPPWNGSPLTPKSHTYEDWTKTNLALAKIGGTSDE